MGGNIAEWAVFYKNQIALEDWYIHIHNISLSADKNHAYTVHVLLVKKYMLMI